jgi:hypothetical protein
MGGSRKNRASMKGGFAPAIMGSFVSNVNAVVAPLVLAGLYKIFGTRKVAKVAKSAKKL